MKHKEERGTYSKNVALKIARYEKNIEILQQQEKTFVDHFAELEGHVEELDAKLEDVTADPEMKKAFRVN